MKRTITTVMAFAAMIFQTYAQKAQLMESLSGRWLLEASNNGVAVEIAPGVKVYRATTDSIYFTAKCSQDGTTLECHTDSLYWRTGTAYPADWHITVEENAVGQYRLGWQLTTSQPVSSVEFNESAGKYMEGGTFYWGRGDDGHRYIYLLGENADNTAFVDMALWSNWTDAAPGSTEYLLQNTDNNARKMYAIVAEDVPFGHSVGYIEIWGSPKIRKADGGSSSGIRETVVQMPPDGKFFDLQGRRLIRPSAPGLYILPNKKKGYCR